MSAASELPLETAAVVDPDRVRDCITQTLRYVRPRP